MHPHLTELGIGGIFALLVIREVFNFIRFKKNGIDYMKLARQIDELHEWHDKEDPVDGVKVWYVRRSLEKAIEQLANNLAQQTKVFQEFSMRERDVVNVLRRLEKKLD